MHNNVKWWLCCINAAKSGEVWFISQCVGEVEGRVGQTVEETPAVSLWALVKSSALNRLQGVMWDTDFVTDWYVTLGMPHTPNLFGCIT